MNERILELAKQAGIKANSEQAMSPQEQLFAELIVQECIGIAHEVGRNPFIEAYEERGKIIKKIKQHFGVES